ncbi:MAG: hypothetical protein OEV23_06185, partial [Gallionella sp.]|nr:hypothetical protein [Gallionella sp.]
MSTISESIRITLQNIYFYITLGWQINAASFCGSRFAGCILVVRTKQIAYKLKGICISVATTATNAIMKRLAVSRLGQFYLTYQPLSFHKRLIFVRLRASLSQQRRARRMNGYELLPSRLPGSLVYCKLVCAAGDE